VDVLGHGVFGHSCAKTAELIKIPLGVDSGRPKESYIRWGPGFPKGRSNFLGGWHFLAHYELYIG